MSLRDACAELVAIWPRLPDLIGADWPQAARAIEPLLRQLAEARSDGARDLKLSEIVITLSSYESVAGRLKAAMDSRVRRDPRDGTQISPPSSEQLTEAILTTSANHRWVNCDLRPAVTDSLADDAVRFVLTFAVDAHPQPGVLRTSQLDIGGEPGDPDVVLTVRVLGPDDVTVTAIEDSLVLVAGGPSQDRARFRLAMPAHGRYSLSALLERDGNVVQVISLSVDTRHPDAMKQSSRGRPIGMAASLQPRQLSIIFPSDHEYQVMLASTTQKRARLPHTPQELDDIVATARESLDGLVFLDPGSGELVHQRGVTIDEPAYQIALVRLARAGYLLYQNIFFGNRADAQLQRLGEALLAELSHGPRRVQVLAAGVPVPWQMMYVAEEFDPERIRLENFLGLGHVLEVLPLDAGADQRQATTDIETSPMFAVDLAVNLDIDTDDDRRIVADQLDYWYALPADRTRVSVRRSKPDVLGALARPDAPQHLLYYFCHATARSRSGSGDRTQDSLVVGSVDGQILLEELRMDAPARHPFSGHPLVVINACDSVGLSPLFYDGLLPYFVAKGARGVIGTDAKTPAVFAAEWARRFFDRLLGGQNVGAAMLGVRRDFVTDDRNLLGLLYAQYCDADIVLTPAVRAVES